MANEEKYKTPDRRVEQEGGRKYRKPKFPIDTIRGDMIYFMAP